MLQTRETNAFLPIFHPFSKESGTAILFVLVLTVILSLMVGSVFFTSRYSLKKSGSRRMDVTAINIAEAGKENGLAKIKSGAVSLIAGQRVSVASDSNFGGGSYVASCSANAAFDSMWLVSTGAIQGRTKSIKALYYMNLAAGGPAFDKGICAGGNITWTGSGSVAAGTTQIHCNGSFSMSGSSDITAYVYACGGLSKSGSCNINGDVYAPTISQTGSGKINGTQHIGPVSTITIPDIDLTPYYDHALTNGQVYFTNQHLSGSSDYIVPGGIMWVEGTFKRSGSGDFTGCVIATGNVDVSGSGDYFKAEKYPLAVSTEGTIDFSGSGNLHGLLYAPNGEFKKTGSGNVEGSIVCKGNFKKSGSWDFLTYVKSIPVPPGGAKDKFSLVTWWEL